MPLPREQGSRLDRYLPYLEQRWEDGNHNIACLFRELVEQGYKGSYESVRDNLVRLFPEGRKIPRDAALKAPTFAPSRQASFLFLRRPEKLRTEEQETLAKLRQLHSEVDLAYDLIQQFVQMLHNRKGECLDAWLAQVASSNLPAKQVFPCSASGCCMHSRVFTSLLQFMPTLDGADHIFPVRQPAPLLHYGRG
jgi:hypothetical protein